MKGDSLDEQGSSGRVKRAKNRNESAGSSQRKERREQEKRQSSIEQEILMSKGGD